MKPFPSQSIWLKICLKFIDEDLIICLSFSRTSCSQFSDEEVAVWIVVRPALAVEAPLMGAFALLIELPARALMVLI